MTHLQGNASDMYSTYIIPRARLLDRERSYLRQREQRRTDPVVLRRHEEHRGWYRGAILLFLFP